MLNLITDEQLEIMKIFLPKKKQIGRPRVDDRKLLNSIIYIVKTGCRWQDIPKEFGKRSFLKMEKLLIVDLKN